MCRGFGFGGCNPKPEALFSFAGGVARVADLEEGSSAENAPPALQISGEMSGKGVVNLGCYTGVRERQLGGLDSL